MISVVIDNTTEQVSELGVSIRRDLSVWFSSFCTRVDYRYCSLLVTRFPNQTCITILGKHHSTATVQGSSSRVCPQSTLLPTRGLAACTYPCCITTITTVNRGSQFPKTTLVCFTFSGFHQMGCRLVGFWYSKFPQAFPGS